MVFAGCLGARLVGSRGRRSLAALVTVIYVLAGALHSLCDLDVTNPGGNGAISFLADASDQGGAGSSGKSILRERHCHGCFAASLDQPVYPAILTELSYVDPPPPRVHIAGIMPETETPPPRHPA